MISSLRFASEPSAERVLLLSAEGLVLFAARPDSTLAGTLFDNDHDGQRQLCQHLAAEAPITLRLLVDIAEEEFRSQELPSLSWADSRRLARKKCRQGFSKASHHHWHWQARGAQGLVLCAALCNAPLLAGWLNALHDCGAAVRCISSPALLADQLPLPGSPALLVLGLHTAGLRISLLLDGQLRLSRLFRMRYGERDMPAICRQLEKMILYLRGQRLLLARVAPDVCVLAAGTVPEQLAAHYQANASAPACRFLAVPAEALPEGGLAETRYAEQLASCAIDHYASRQDTRLWRGLQARRRINGLGLGLVFVAALYAGHQGLAGLLLARQGEAVAERTAAYARLVNQAREALPPLVVNAEGLRDNMQQLAVWQQPGLDGGDAMRLLSRALQAHGAIEARTIRWTAEAPDSHRQALKAAPPTRRDRMDATPAPAHMEVVLEAALPDFNGDYQAAMATVQRFAETLRRDPASHSVEFLHRPFVTGDQVRGRANDATRPVHFSLSIRL